MLSNQFKASPYANLVTRTSDVPLGNPLPLEGAHYILHSLYLVEESPFEKLHKKPTRTSMAVIAGIDFTIDSSKTDFPLASSPNVHCSHI